MKFYLAGAIRSGRGRIETYIKINELLEKHGEVLDKHVANPNVYEMEKSNTVYEIYDRDLNWIKDCDIVVAEVSTPSLGVGYEIAYAESLGKRIICICDNEVNLSAMISGDKYIELIRYSNCAELLSQLEMKL